MLLVLFLIVTFSLLLSCQICEWLYQCWKPLSYQVLESFVNDSDNEKANNSDKEKANEKGGKPSYQPYDTNASSQCLILAQQNAGNIEVLKGRLDDQNMDKMNKRMQDMQLNVDMLQTQVNSLVKQQANFAADLAGDQPLTIGGLSSTSSSSSTSSNSKVALATDEVEVDINQT